MKGIKIVLLILALVLSLLNFSFAEEQAKSSGVLKGIEVYTGYGLAKLHYKGSYKIAPLILDLDFDLKPAIKKIGFCLPGTVEFQLEPFVSYVYRPEKNVEVGNAFMLKFGILPETSKFQIYGKAGIGYVYMSQHTTEQKTHSNYLEQGGVGIAYFFRKNLALNFDCRFRHVSNAGRAYPNHGINTIFFLLGTTYQF